MKDLSANFDVSFPGFHLQTRLSVPESGVTVLFGPSGSGKTTLAMALCGLAPVMSGKVAFHGDDVPKDKHGLLQPDRCKISLMFQDPVGSLSPRMTVRKLLAEPYQIHGIEAANADNKAMEMLDMVGLSAEFADRYPHQLSGGQARRVSSHNRRISSTTGGLNTISLIFSA